MLKTETFWQPPANAKSKQNMAMAQPKSKMRNKHAHGGGAQCIGDTGIYSPKNMFGCKL
jgi:hypothetical protein